MLNKDRKLYGLKDVAIMPSALSGIEHRSECNPFYEDGKLPIFTAPMPCVVNLATYKTYEDNGINSILPRTEDINVRIDRCVEQWCAFSLDEFDELFIIKRKNRNNLLTSQSYHVLIDIANGHMLKLYEHSKFAKNYFGDKLKLMVGNIANPEAFRKFCEIGVDYVRCSVGSGAGCLTATELGILYPMASLIDECHRIRKELNSNTKIVADGGISSFRRMFKSLALGADYVMLGSTLNKLEDSAGEIIKKVEPTLKGPVTVKYKEYYGMASEKGMKMLGKTGTPEGKVIFNKCNGTIASFTNEFINLFKSLMSYCNIKSVETFIGVPELNILSDNASEQFNQSR